MRVRATRTEGGFTRGHEYLVITILDHRDPQERALIAPLPHVDDEPSTLHGDQYEVLDPTIPSEWVSHAWADGTIETGPASFAALPAFWNAYVEEESVGDPPDAFWQARTTYFAELARLRGDDRDAE